jgi:hypothetical protein
MSFLANLLGGLFGGGNRQRPVQQQQQQQPAPTVPETRRGGFYEDRSLTEDGLDPFTGEMFNRAGSQIVKRGGGGPIGLDMGTALDIGGDEGLKFLKEMTRARGEGRGDYKRISPLFLGGGSKRARNASEEIRFRNADRLNQIRQKYLGQSQQRGSQVQGRDAGALANLFGSGLFGRSQGAFTKEQEDAMIANASQRAMDPITAAARGVGASMVGRGIGANPFAQTAMMNDALVAGGRAAGDASRTMRMFEAQMGERPSFAQTFPTDLSELEERYRILSGNQGERFRELLKKLSEVGQ